MTKTETHPMVEGENGFLFAWHDPYKRHYVYRLGYLPCYTQQPTTTLEQWRIEKRWKIKKKIRRESYIRE